MRRRYGRAEACSFCHEVRCGAAPGSYAPPCAGLQAKIDKNKNVAKAEPIVCAVCGRPGCWTDASGCPGVRDESKGVA